MDIETSSNVEKTDIEKESGETSSSPQNSVVKNRDDSTKQKDETTSWSNRGSCFLIIIGLVFFLSSVSLFCSFLFFKSNVSDNPSIIISVCVFSSLMLVLGFSLIAVSVCLGSRKRFEIERIKELQKLEK
jgi:O-antigen/teichoic acid export membrane protein